MVLRRAIPLALGLCFSASLVAGLSRAADPPRRPEPLRTFPGRQGLRVPPQNAVAKDEKPAPPGPAPELPAVPPPHDLKLPGPDSIKPTPLVAIPDNPPPHEGAMFDLPYVIEPPDLLIVELLEALPGRPISGERLVRPDGTIGLGFYGDVHVKGLSPVQAKEKVILHMSRYLVDEVLGLIEFAPDGNHHTVPLRDSNRVFVDVTAYNSTYYYVRGDIFSPGRLPFTGKETVLDALDYAGGPIATADRKNIRLIRPARAGKPTRTLTVDLNAIENGDASKNYQVFPGDRLIVGRDELVAATIQQDRQTAHLQTLSNALRQVTAMSNELARATPDLKPEEREKLVKDWVEIWWKSAQKPGGPVADEATFRELLLKAVRASSKPENSGKADAVKPGGTPPR
jgi:polysaccharide biosynthesis/export protein